MKSSGSLSTGERSNQDKTKADALSRVRFVALVNLSIPYRVAWL